MMMFFVAFFHKFVVVASYIAYIFGGDLIESRRQYTGTGCCFSAWETPLCTQHSAQEICLQRRIVAHY